MKYSLRTKLSISYVFVAMLLVAMLSIVANFLLEKQFRKYIIMQQEQKNREIVSLISQQYKSKTSTWDIAVIENIGISALEQGLIVKVEDSGGTVVWDATVHNHGLCVQMLNHMSQNMSSRYPNFQGGYVETGYPVKHNFAVVGKVEIGYYGPFYLSDNDLAFINTLNKMLIAIGIFSLLFALLLGAYMAKRLSTPISRVITTARQISDGFLNNRIKEQSNTKEIIQLTSSINNLAETLEKQESLRKQLTADVAHELRTPLATLQSHMEAMIDGIWKPETGRLKSCHEEIMRLSRMIGDLEKLARFESGNLILYKEKFDLSELIKQILQNCESDFRNKGVELNSSLESVIVTADRDKISQIIVNLVSNALKFTPEGGSALVCTNRMENCVIVTVKDSGIGIAPEDIPFIFERFYRADKSRNRMTGGSGIGLTIVKAIVEAHHGKITVQSKPYEGAEFIVTLPYYEN